MARKQSKLDRMGEAESILADISIVDGRDSVSDMLDSLNNFEEYREGAENAFAEAQGYHEERDWDSRNSSLEEAQNAVEEMSTALDELDNMPGVPVELEPLREVVGKCKEHLDQLIDY